MLELDGIVRSRSHQYIVVETQPSLESFVKLIPHGSAVSLEKVGGQASVVILGSLVVALYPHFPLKLRMNQGKFAMIILFLPRNRCLLSVQKQAFLAKFRDSRDLDNKE